MSPGNAPGAAGAVSRPRVVDYLLVLCGCFVSMMLAEMSELRAVSLSPASPALMAYFLRILPHMLFLPMGIVLLWPLFFATQKVLGRQQGMTVGEWLWGLAWLGALFLSAWIAWRALGTLPEFLAGSGFRRGIVTGYVIVVLSLAAVALIVFLFDLVGRWTQPWTHQLSLVLMMWPALPLAAVWLWKIKLE